MFWESIVAAGHTDLLVSDKDTLRGQRYRDETLAPYVKPFSGANGPNFIFMDDNARPHRVWLDKEFPPIG
ncbi:hypothetical protein TNCV_2422171 [Trichonephila clavipes]|nr:hypothetical protein TNCV_2422171 [Trichonephila clavipes]